MLKNLLTRHLIVLATIVLLQSPSARAETPASASENPVKHDGQHDFDFEIGTWRTHVRRLAHPLTGSTAWLEMSGTTVVRSVADGRGNLAELVADGPNGRFNGISLRLFNPKAQQWSLNFANLSDGVLTTPTIGQFNGARGEFYSQERLGDRAILVRFVIIRTSDDSCRFEQSFSDDGGKSWELNWIAVDTRVTDAATTPK